MGSNNGSPSERLDSWSRLGMIERENRSGGRGILQRARRAPSRGRHFQMADSNIGGSSLTRAELREEFDRFRDGMFRCCATKADVANLKTWMVGLLLVVVLNVVGTAGAIVAAVLTR